MADIKLGNTTKADEAYQLRAGLNVVLDGEVAKNVTNKRYAVSLLSTSRAAEAFNLECLCNLETGEYRVKNKDGFVLSYNKMARQASFIKEITNTCYMQNLIGTLAEVSIDDRDFPFYFPENGELEIGVNFPINTTDYLVAPDFIALKCNKKTFKQVDDTHNMTIKLYFEDNNGTEVIITSKMNMVSESKLKLPEKTTLKKFKKIAVSYTGNLLEDEDVIVVLNDILCCYK